MLKKFLAEKGVTFEEIDLSTSPDRIGEMMDVSGQMGVPVTVVDDKEVIVGYNRERLEQVLTA